VYQTQRFSTTNYTYTIPNLTPGSSYIVNLHFVEIYWTAPGQRLFNAAINGVPVLSNFDIVARAGGPDIAIVESFTTTASGAGTITIELTLGAVNFPTISGIQIFSNGVGQTSAVTLTANPGAITIGGSSTLSWTSTNATSCTASGGWSGPEPASGTTSVAPATTTSYTLTCSGSSGSPAQATASVAVNATAALPDWVYYNGRFTWPGDLSFAGTPSYSSSAGPALSGSFSIQMVTQQGGGWQPYAPVSSLDLTPYNYLTLALKPTVTGQAWNCYFMTTGALSPGTVVSVLNYGPAPVAGQWGVYNIPLADLGVSGASIANFTIQDEAGVATNTWYIDNVGFTPSIPAVLPPTATISANPILLTSPGTVTLSWSSANATSCVASGGWSGPVPPSGTQSVALTATSGYAITCTSVGGSAYANAGVTVTNPNVFSIQISGNQFVNGAGTPLQLRGVALSALEFVAVQGWDPADPTGGQFGQPNNPNWAAIQSWKADIVRIPLNEDSWLGLTCVDTDGLSHYADPGGNYKQALANLVQQANAAGLYVILDLHWAAPGSTCPLLQTQMADSDHSLAFWTSLANAYKNNPAVMFELFNEPLLDTANDFTGDPWQYMMFGTGGAFSGYPATSNRGNLQNIATPWNIASFQDMINAVRATGATNPVLIGSVAYTADLTGWLSHVPADPLNQMAATWHAYPTYPSAWGSYAWSQPNYAPQVFVEVQNILAAGIPVIITETGDQDSAGTVGAPLMQTVTNFADANGVSVVGWTWDIWPGPDFILIQDVNGTPTDGYGQFFQSWLVNHP
jgi:hypothetical protein